MVARENLRTRERVRNKNLKESSGKLPKFKGNENGKKEKSL
jgi:hypothetical protein